MPLFSEMEQLAAAIIREAAHSKLGRAIIAGRTVETYRLELEARALIDRARTAEAMERAAFALEVLAGLEPQEPGYTGVDLDKHSVDPEEVMTELRRFGAVTDEDGAA